MPSIKVEEFQLRIAPPNAVGVLEAAMQHLKDRGALRDKPDGERSMARAIAAFNALAGTELTEEQGWLFMVVLKAARALGGGYNSDDYEDGAGYFALAGESASRDFIKEFGSTARCGTGGKGGVDA